MMENIKETQFKMKVGNSENPAREVILAKLQELGIDKPTHSMAFREYVIYDSYEMTYAAEYQFKDCSYKEITPLDLGLKISTLTKEELGYLGFNQPPNFPITIESPYTKGDIELYFIEEYGFWVLLHSKYRKFYGEIPTIEHLQLILKLTVKD